MLAVALLGAFAATASPAVALPPGFTERTVFTGLDHPTAVRFASDGRVFVAEKSGLVRVFDSLTDTTPTRFADLRTNVHNFWDRGLLGLALDPAFPARPYVYVAYTYDAPIGGTAPRWGVAGATTDGCPTPPGATTDGCVVSGRISRLQVSPANTLVGAELVLVQRLVPAVPEPLDRRPRVRRRRRALRERRRRRGLPHERLGTARRQRRQPDAAQPVRRPARRRSERRWRRPPPRAARCARRTCARAATRSALDGSVIRIDPDTGAARAGNPLAGSSRRQRAPHRRPRVPQPVPPGRSAPARTRSGSATWATRAGRRSTASSRRPRPSRNFGWPCYEGAPRQPNWDFNNLNICEDLYASRRRHRAVLRLRAQHEPRRPRRHVHPRRTQASTSGLAFYAGTAYPAAYAGALFFADYTRDCIWVMRAGAGGVPDVALREPFRPDAPNPVDLEIGPGGDLFYVDFDGGTIRRIEYASGNRAPIADATATPAERPGAADRPLRRAAVPRDPDGDTLTYAWDLDADGQFDDGTTAVVDRHVHRCGQRHGGAARARPGGPRGDRRGRRHAGQHATAADHLGAARRPRAGASATSSRSRAGRPTPRAGRSAPRPCAGR